MSDSQNVVNCFMQTSVIIQFADMWISNAHQIAYLVRSDCALA